MCFSRNQVVKTRMYIKLAGQGHVRTLKQCFRISLPEQNGLQNMGSFANINHTISHHKSFHNNSTIILEKVEKYSHFKRKTTN
jgi:hypothetical protein